MNREIVRKENNIGFVSNEVSEGIIKASDVYGLKILLYISRENNNVTTIDIGKNVVELSMKVSEVAKYCNITSRTLYDNIKTMGKTQIEYDLPEKGQGFYQLIPEANIKDGILTIIMNTRLYSLFTKEFLNESYTTILQLDKLMKIKKNAHAIRIFLLLNRFNKYTKGIPKQKRFESLDELNDFFQVNYDTLSNMKSSVLNKIEKNLKGLIPCKFIPINGEGSGRGKKPIIGYILIKLAPVNIIEKQSNPEKSLFQKQIAKL